MNKYILIVAGGSGSRMGNNTPKQFLEIYGKPVLMHTFESFFSTKQNFKYILVLPEDQIQFWKDLCEKHIFNIPHIIVPGGSERYFSVKNGLQTVSENGFIAVHDGVRPLVSKETIIRCFEEAEKHGCAIPCIDIPESIRQITENASHAEDRTKYKIIQTPQVFSISLLQEAYKLPYEKSFTDDASVFEKAGNKIHLVKGNEENIKITKPTDLLIAEVLMKMK
ncbi:MAG: 2-C-methyl-D-erythritol 4-phosphate cytidylyltransferase [Bacteroidetes bacterium RIFOXYA12_FULL_35_11]|nr:MAG: 2-C-methyl-D-erythritol 4-phosphate cytidylyltransferase [Bacteroidetes bacterium GWF2_35_48]OFY82996.1 MAG: 2-C-methyl-D-erythritol 4-phosphate cytidylyltransferase [Bacteroidetes bacterium RIFOXYA12_FULL_35_11]HBX49500.1 2-C-methyl-D-erythritol 4-phosphate cytidylyltransferase [Bacteroidales bacterium]